MKPLFTVFAALLLPILAAASTAHGANAPDTAIADVKLYPVPAEHPKFGAFAVFLTGDGGWAALDKSVSKRLADAGLPVVGFDCLSYFWKRHSPEETTHTVSAIIARYRARWHLGNVVLIGYSRGADVLPFVVNRLAPTDRSAVKQVCLLGPADWIDFEFHMTDWLHGAKSPRALAVVPEIEKLSRSQLLVIYGRNDHDSCGPRLPADVGHIEAVPGDHHFDRNYDLLARLILEQLSQTGHPR